MSGQKLMKGRGITIDRMSVESFLPVFFLTVRHTCKLLANWRRCFMKAKKINLQHNAENLRFSHRWLRFRFSKKAELSRIENYLSNR